jgi:hypothetical protein
MKKIPKKMKTLNKMENKIKTMMMITIQWIIQLISWRNKIYHNQEGKYLKNNKRRKMKIEGISKRVYKKNG